jgi:hypothetical protein
MEEKNMLWALKKKTYRAQQRVMKNVAKVLPFPFPTPSC